MRDRIAVVHKGVTSLRRSPSGGRPLPPMNGVVVGSLGPFGAEGGVDLLFRAAAAWRPRLPAFTLLVAAEGAGAAGLRQLAAELGLQARIAFVDASTDQVELLRAMDICVLPSPHEACPVALLEAMLAGKAVIAPDLGGIDELLQSGQEGLLVRPEDPACLTEAVLTLAHDAALRTRLGATARRRVTSDFTLERMVDGTLEVYRRLTSHGGGNRHEYPLRAVPAEILDPAAAP